MEIILEHEDIEALLKKALRKEGVMISDSAQMKVRQNHKKGTIRVVFKENRHLQRTRPRVLGRVVLPTKET